MHCKWHTDRIILRLQYQIPWCILFPGGIGMRRIDFSIEDNEKFLEIGQTYEVTEFLSANYFYMLENAYGMSPPIPLNQRLKTNRGKLIEIKQGKVLKLATLEFNE